MQGKGGGRREARRRAPKARACLSLAHTLSSEHDECGSLAPLRSRPPSPSSPSPHGVEGPFGLGGRPRPPPLLLFRDFFNRSAPVVESFSRVASPARITFIFEVHLMPGRGAGQSQGQGQGGPGELVQSGPRSRVMLEGEGEVKKSKGPDRCSWLFVASRALLSFCLSPFSPSRVLSQPCLLQGRLRPLGERCPVPCARQTAAAGPQS